MPSATAHIAPRLAAARATFLEMLESIPEDRLGDVPSHFDKNAAWLAGHLRLADDLALKLLGVAHPGMEPRVEFGPGSSGAATLEAFRAALRSRDEAVRSLKASHGRLVEVVKALPDAALDRPITEERVKAFFPDVGTLLLYMVWHEGWHAGQLSQWCKALGVGKPVTA